jgi:hypothetical protein
MGPLVQRSSRGYSWGRGIAGVGRGGGAVAVLIKQELLLPMIGGVFMPEPSR